MISSKRWFYLFIATLTMLFLGLIYAWSIFRMPLSEIYPGWTVSQLSLTFSVSMICFCLGGFISGLLNKKLSPCARLLLSASILFIGFFCASTIKQSDPENSLIKLYVFYGAFCGSGVGIAYIIIISSLNRWFPDKVGLTSGIMMSGFGLGGLLLGGVVDIMITSLGVLSVFRVIGIAIASVCVAAAFIIKVPTLSESENIALKAGLVGSKSKGLSDVSGVVSDNTHIVDCSPVEMLQTAEFWLFAIWVILLNSAGLLVINSAAIISVTFEGTAVMGLIVSLFNGAGRIIAGNNFDRYGIRKSTLVNNIFMLLAGLLLVLACISNKFFFIFVGLIFVGMSYGGCPAISSAYINRRFGTKYFSINFSITNFSLIPAAAIGPMISSRLLEASGGNYNTNFYAIVAFAVVAATMRFMLNSVSVLNE